MKILYFLVLLILLLSGFIFYKNHYSQYTFKEVYTIKTQNGVQHYAKYVVNISGDTIYTNGLINSERVGVYLENNETYFYNKVWLALTLYVAIPLLLIFGLILFGFFYNKFHNL